MILNDAPTIIQYYSKNRVYQLRILFGMQTKEEEEEEEEEEEQEEEEEED